jgi:hypothetical protein
LLTSHGCLYTYHSRFTADVTGGKPIAVYLYMYDLYVYSLSSF